MLNLEASFPDKPTYSLKDKCASENILKFISLNSLQRVVELMVSSEVTLLISSAERSCDAHAM